MIIYGKQVCLYALQHHPERIKHVYLQKKHQLSKQLFRAFEHSLSWIDARKAQAMSRGGNHQGILVDIEEIEPVGLSELKQGSFLVVLDHVTDVGNIGAIVRTAYALGADGVVVCGMRRLNMPAVVRTSTGALLDMPVAVIPNVADVLHELSQVGFVRYGASMEGDPVETVTFASKRVLILGSEGDGLSTKALEKTDRFVAIRMKRPFDSLNVSAAAAILLHRMSYAVERIA